MSAVISLIGIVLGLVLLVVLAYKGHSIIWVAPFCAILVALLGGLDLPRTLIPGVPSPSAHSASP